MQALKMFVCADLQRCQCYVSCRISYLEIYNETMFDLLSTLPESMAVMDQVTPLTVHEDPEYGVYVKGLSCHLAQNEEEALNLLFEVSVPFVKGKSPV